jgi:RNA polymerase sigma factor, sigma-70 family
MPRVPEEDSDAEDAGEPPRFPDSRLFERDVLALLPVLRRYAASLTGSAAEGEDLLQDCVERVFRRRRQWRGGSLRAWAFAIMTNLSRDRFRDPARGRTEPIEPHADTLPADTRIDAEELARLARALEALSADHRAVLMLVAVEGHSYREVAEILDIPAGTVMSRLARARAALTDAMAADNVISLRRPR